MPHCDLIAHDASDLFALRVFLARTLDRADAAVRRAGRTEAFGFEFVARQFRRRARALGVRAECIARIINWTRDAEARAARRGVA